jgi:uncharacterized phiE125 gp8 family phage protein
MATLDKALTTLARLKTYLEVSGTSKDALLTMILYGAWKFIEKYTGRSFARAVRTSELYDGHDTDKLILKAAPVISGETFTLQRRTTGLNEDAWETIDTEEYFIDYDKGIITMNTKFVAGTQNYRVTYTAGYYVAKDTQYQDGTNDELDLPYDIEMACWKLCSQEYANRKNQGRISERVRDMAVTYAKAIDKDEELKSTLGLYKRSFYA